MTEDVNAEWFRGWILKAPQFYTEDQARRAEDTKVEEGKFCRTAPAVIRALKREPTT